MVLQISIAKPRIRERCMAKRASRNSRSSLRVAEPAMACVGTLCLPESEAYPSAPKNFLAIPAPRPSNFVRALIIIARRQLAHLPGVLCRIGRRPQPVGAEPRVGSLYVLFLIG